MAYLGSTPTTSSQSLVKQDFSVSATQNYTLSQSVTNANDIALYINNVRQEPTYAYSASGTSLTLTAATAGSDDMYCVYLGRAVGTINPASGSVGLGELSATGTKNSTTFLRGDNSFAVPGGGKLLQLVNVHNNDYATYSNTNVDSKVQVLTASITPSATSSKILITGFISMSSTNSSVQHYGVTIKRGSTIIGEGDASSWNSGVGTAHSMIGSSQYSKPDKAPLLHFLDTPNTTSATTYNFFAYANHFGSSVSNSTLVVNGGGYTYNNKETGVPTSNITLMEIGA